MKKALFLTAICAALTACGGGSGGSNGGGSDPAPSPTPKPTPTNVTCTLPSDATSVTYYGASVYGSAASWQFAQVGTALQPTVNGTQASSLLSPSANGCTYTNSSVGNQGIAATFNEYGIVATTLVGNDGISYPALAVSSPESMLNAATAAKIAGTYSMVNYEQNVDQTQSTPSTSYSSYFRQLTVSSTLSGLFIVGTITISPTETHNIRFMPNMNPGQNGHGYTYQVEDQPGQWNSEGTAFFKTVGTETILVLGVNSNVNSEQAHGMWIGSNAPVSSFNNGLYVDNGVDDAGFNTINQSTATSFVALTGTTIYADNTYTISPNTPSGTNFYGVAFANEPNSIGVASALGLTAIAGQYGPRPTEKVPGAAPGFVFMLKPKQTQQ